MNFINFINLKNIKNFLRHPLIYGSVIVVTGNLAANFLNFLFNLYMKRTLSNADYGTLATIISLITFPALIASAVVPLVIRYAGDYFATGKLHMVRGLYITMTKFVLVVGLLVSLLFFIFIPQISSFFHITNRFILIVTAIIIFLTFMNVINVAFIQAKLAFMFQVVISNIGALLKLLVGVGLVFIGFSVNGAVISLLVSGIGLYVLGFMPIRFVFNKNIASPKLNTKELFAYGIPSSLTLLGLTSLISADIILVKHFFSPTMAGIYAGLSLIGRVIFYLSAPISNVMFPIMVQKHTKKENLSRTFSLALLLILAPSSLLTAFYFLFPKFTVLFFTGRHEDLIITPYLGMFGIFITLYCLVTVFSTFYLSIKKTAVFIPIILSALLQIILIYFHHQNFMQIITMSIITTSLLVITLLAYFPYATKRTI